MEELVEALTWTQLGIQQKPVGVLNVNGYYDAFVELIDKAVEDGFIRASHRDIFIVDDDPERLLARLLVHKPPPGFIEPSEWEADAI